MKNTDINLLIISEFAFVNRRGKTRFYNQFLH